MSDEGIVADKSCKGLTPFNPYQELQGLLNLKQSMSNTTLYWDKTLYARGNKFCEDVRELREGNLGTISTCFSKFKASGVGTILRGVDPPGLGFAALGVTGSHSLEFMQAFNRSDACSKMSCHV